MIEKIKAIIVDDEERSILLNQNMLDNYCPEISVMASYDSIDKAYTGILEHKPDIVFLDIDLPPYTGFDLLRKFPSIDFEIIFITAFNQYAIDAIRFSALDYLMKPVNPDELQAAVKKAYTRFHPKQQNVSMTYHQQIGLNEVSKLVIRSQRGIDLIEIDDIVFFEAQNVYTEFTTKTRKVLSTKAFTEYEDMFQNKGFYKIHRSYMVNMNHVKYLDIKEGDEVLMNYTDIRLPLSRRRKQEFYERLLPLK
jgi:two-component system LytT family response regulator